MVVFACRKGVQNAVKVCRQSRAKSNCQTAGRCLINDSARASSMLPAGIHVEQPINQ